MLAILVALASSLLISLLGTPFFIRFLVSREYGQFIRQDGPTQHYTKRGTPTMGGVIIILATVIGTILAFAFGGHLPSVPIILLLFLFVGLGAIGFIDDFTKISKQRSLGLNPTAKIVGQLAVGTIFTVLALTIPVKGDLTTASYAISIIRDTNFSLARWGMVLGLVLAVLWINFLIAAWSNAVNLTDGLDGLATGASMVAFGAYTFIAIWQYYQDCARAPEALHACYQTVNPLGLAIFSSAIVGACFGFLWWNAAPAKIFMGDTGALALGGAFAGLSVLTRTEFLALIIGGLFVAEVLSDVIQIGFFKMSGKLGWKRRRVFKMAPIHHHFELKGWREITIVIRFWLVAGLCAIAGVVIFYGQWVGMSR